MKKTLLSTAIAASLLTTGVAHAQLEEVVVTAQKRSQDLQDVSAAVTSINADDLKTSQINNIEDLQVLVPGLTFGNDFNFAKIFVRGVGMSSSFAGIDPSVALHVDGAVISQAAAQFASLFDLERVEFLRGPQGTLYGRNATGGSINLITAKPTDEFEGYGKFTLGGSDLNIIAEGAVSGPLSDTVRGRLAFWKQKRDGFGIHTGTGQDIDDANKLGIRAHLEWDIADNINNLFTIENFDEDENSRAVKFIRASFPTTGNPGLFAIGLPDVYPNSRNAGGDFVPVATLDTTSFTNTLSWDLSDEWAFKSITNRRKFSNVLVQDFDVSDTDNSGWPDEPGTTSTTQRQSIDNIQFSEELQFVYEGDRLSGIVGMYYFTDDIDSLVLIGKDPVNAPDRVRVYVGANMDVKAYAAFTNFNYRFTDQLSGKFGLRYSNEERSVESLFGVDSPAPTVNAAVFDPIKNTSKKFSDVSPELGVEYRTEDDSLLYATYSEGFKSGTANLGERTPSVVDPETIKNYEFGYKTTSADNTLQTNIALFAYEVSDAQFDRTFPIPVPPFFSARLENAAVTDGKGIELETRWAPDQHWTVDFNATWYDISFDEFLSLDPLNEDLFGAASTSVQPVSLAGNSPRNTPDWTYNVKVSYDHNLANGGSLRWGGNVAAKGKQYYTEFNNPVMAADAYTIVDANVLYTAPDERFTANFWVKNLTDEMVLSGAFAISTSRTITGTYLPPRQYGVTLGYTF